MTKKSLLVLASLLALPMAIHAETAKQTDKTAEVAAKNDSLERGMKALQGRWKVVGTEIAGNQGPAAVMAALRYEFKGDKLIVTPSEPGYSVYTLQIHPDAKPISTIDMSLPGNKQGASMGIYAMEGNQLKICLGKQKRPIAFLTNKETGFGQALITLERE